MFFRSKFVLFIFLIFCLISPKDVLAFSGSGSGIQADPFIITNCSQLSEINNNLGAYYILGNDINCIGVDFQPMGAYSSDPFTGTLDGQGHSVANLVINQTGDYVALFPYVTGGIIKNITLESGSVTSDGSYVGSIAGYVDTNFTLLNVISNLDITINSASALNAIGGLVGDVEGELTITNSNYTGNIDVTSNQSIYAVGGYVGYVLSVVDIDNSFVQGSISITGDSSVNSIGCMIGLTDADISINNSHAEGNLNIISNVSYVEYSGGIVGSTQGDLLITQSYFLGNIDISAESDSYYIGGLNGYSSGSIDLEDSYVVGNITITSNSDYLNGIGGLIGYNDGLVNTSIDTSHYTGDINLTAENHAQYVGGLVGYTAMDVAVSNSNVEGDIISISNTASVGALGGLLGGTDGTLDITESHFVGDILLTAEGDIFEIGSLAGQVILGTIVTSSYSEGNITATTSSTIYDSGGLLGQLDSLTITGSHFVGDIVFTAENNISSVAGLVGYSNLNTEITSSYVEGNITLTSNTGSVSGIGGLTGNINTVLIITDSHYSGNLDLTAETYVEKSSSFIGYVGNNTTINSSYAEGNINVVTATDYIGYLGGLVGLGFSSITISDSHYEGHVNWNAGYEVYYSGGLVGSANSNLTITSSYVEGDLTLYAHNGGFLYEIGGLVGDGSTSTITGSHYSGDITLSTEANSDVQQVGGVVGYASNSATVESSYTRGNITSTLLRDVSGVGGIIGQTFSGATISNSFSTMNITGKNKLGGLVGDGVGIMNISNSYSNGNIEGEDYLGGLVGNSFGDGIVISRSFSSGLISGESAINYGAVLGFYSGLLTSNNNYFDISKTGQTLCASQDVGGTNECTGVNADNLTPNYFYNTDSISPISLWAFGTDSWESISSYDEHTLTLKSNGTLWATGYNSSGQLGVGDINSRDEFTQVEGNWIRVEVMREGSIGIKTDGTLWSWGYSINDDYGNTPTQIGTDTDWQKLAAGSYHALLIKNNGTLWSLGHNAVGELGIGSFGSPEFIPVQVGTDTDWQTVGAGTGHSFGIKTDGTLWSWGNNDSGELGLGDTEKRNTPVQVGSSNNWSKIDGGGDDAGNDPGHTIALMSDGTLWSWGYNSNGQLGLDDTDDRYIPTQIGTDANWQDISAGSFSSFGIKTNGILYGWGKNNHYQLGLDDTDERHTPTQVGVSGVWSDISAGTNYSVGIKNGTPWGWGYNTGGQLGATNLGSHVTAPTEMAQVESAIWKKNNDFYPTLISPSYYFTPRPSRPSGGSGAKIPNPNITLAVNQLSTVEEKVPVLVKLEDVSTKIENIHTEIPKTPSMQILEKENCRIYINLMLSYRGPAVTCLQRILNIAQDGIFGVDTRSAVIDFQIQHKLRGDGIVGPKTRKILSQYFSI
jgi:alpha-tubulin suppressor-like RCC1 family protein